MHPLQAYEENVVKLSRIWAEEAARRKVKVFVQISTAEVYDSGEDSPRKTPSTETSELKPPSTMAKHHVVADEQLKQLKRIKGYMHHRHEAPVHSPPLQTKSSDSTTCSDVWSCGTVWNQYVYFVITRLPRLTVVWYSSKTNDGPHLQASRQ